jgi:hypothetical protein
MITGPTREYLRQRIPEYALPAAWPQSSMILARRLEAVYYSQGEPGPDPPCAGGRCAPSPAVAEGGDHRQGRMGPAMPVQQVRARSPMSHGAGQGVYSAIQISDYASQDHASMQLAAETGMQIGQIGIFWTNRRPL